LDWIEKDVEDHLFAHPEILGCQVIYGRQLAVGVGTLDLLGLRTRTDDDGDWAELVVIEIKKDRIDCNAVGQVSRYAHAVANSLTLEIPVTATLVGMSIDTDALLLCSLLDISYYCYQPGFYVTASQRVARPLEQRLEDRVLTHMDYMGGAVTDWFKEQWPSRFEPLQVVTDTVETPSAKLEVTAPPPEEANELVQGTGGI
jgi:hypothetical protein